MKTKYFVKYKEYTNGDPYRELTRFFTCEDIEEEWLRFKAVNPLPVSITDIIVLNKVL